MNRATLTAQVAERTKLSKLAADRAVEAVLQSITESLRNGEPVSLAGFGSFKVLRRAPRMVINPKTRTAIRVPEAVVPRFRPGSNLRLAIEISHREAA